MTCSHSNLPPRPWRARIPAEPPAAGEPPRSHGCTRPVSRVGGSCPLGPGRPAPHGQALRAMSMTPRPRHRWASLLRGPQQHAAACVLCFWPRPARRVAPGVSTGPASSRRCLTVGLARADVARLRLLSAPPCRRTPRAAASALTAPPPHLLPPNPPRPTDGCALSLRRRRRPRATAERTRHAPTNTARTCRAAGPAARA